MNLEMSSSALGPLCAFCSSVTWAIGSTGYAQLSRQHSPFAINFSRALLAFPLFIIATVLSAGGVSEAFAQYATLQGFHFGWLTLAMLASYGVGDVLFMSSTRSLGIPGALAIASSYPLWVAIAGYVFLGERLSVVQWIGLVVALSGIGIVILSSRTQSHAIAKKTLAQGILLAVLTSVFWSLHGYAVSRGGKDLSLPVGNTARMGAALLVCLGSGKLIDPQSKLVLPLNELRRNFWLFTLEAFVGSCLFMYGMSHSPLAVGSTLSALAPVISVPAAWILGVEKFSIPRTFGVCLVVFGILMLMSGF